MLFGMQGGVSHNNVCMASIYVSCNDGGWRLGAMEHLCKFEDATLQVHVISMIKIMLNVYTYSLRCWN